MNLPALNLKEFDPYIFDGITQDLAQGLPLQERTVKASDAKESLLKFTCFTKPDYFVNWHHRIMCEKLDRFARGDLKRLIIQAPPRTGKSEVVSRRLPAYIHGINPNAEIISCSYGADLASRMNRDVQRIIMSPAYHEVFPETRLWEKNIRTIADGSYLRNSTEFEIVNHKGTYRCSGVGGSITGTGGQFLILDDFIKNAAEAESETFREGTWEWYVTTFYTRLETELKSGKKGSILITATRWNSDDVIGRLLAAAAKNPEAEQWEVLTFPMVQEVDPTELDTRKIGEVLWPEKYDVGDVKKIKISLGSKNFQSLHQQNPTAVKGNLVKREHFKFYKELPATWDYFSTSWDFTFKDDKKSDYVVGQAWMKLGARFYLVDQIRDQMSFKACLIAMATFAAKYPYANEHLVEDKANGPAILDVVDTKIAACIPINPTESKYSRAVAVSPKIEAGNIWLPHPDIAPWVGDFIEEWMQFPRGKHDDQVDATSQYLNRMSDKMGWFEESSDNTDEENSQAMSEAVAGMFGWDLNG